MSAWLGVNSILTELPVIVQKAPEGWNLPSQIIIILQLGNFGSLILLYLKKKLKLSNFAVIICLLVLSVVGSLMVGTFSKKTIFLFGYKRSVPIFCAAFIFALIGYSSLVLFIPFIAEFKECYLISYFIGESLSALAPGTLALIQGVEKNATCVVVNSTNTMVSTSSSKFGMGTFFIIIAFVFLSSLLAFSLMNSRMCKQKYVPIIGKNVSCSIDLNNNSEQSTRKISNGDSFTLLAILFVSFMLYSGILPRYVTL